MGLKYDNIMKEIEVEPPVARTAPSQNPGVRNYRTRLF